MRRDPDIPHWTVPVPPETEYDSNTLIESDDSVTYAAATDGHARLNRSDAFAACLRVSTVAPSDYRANLVLA